MRAMLFMSRIVGMVIVMVAVLLSVFIVLDIMREGPHARGFLLGSGLWHELTRWADRLF
ncbi:hypothetical protein [Paragemmobacter aquarius]|uniref:hypothetical protein n=1 Tax=Paragemmobacter aquarius TaxID=2169400 RepID=UPI00131F021F|nr:hypothetical protein [Gemmobacter aquarius]